MESDTSFFVPVNACDSQSVNWSSCQLLLPSIGVGNVAQLATDLIIATLKNENDCDLIGRIDCDSLIPVCGPDPFTFKGRELMTTCQGS